MKTIKYFEIDAPDHYELATGQMLDDEGLTSPEALNSAFEGQGIFHEFTLLYPSQRVAENITRASSTVADDGTLKQDALRVGVARACELVSHYTRIEFRPGQAPLREDGPMTPERYGKLHNSLSAYLDLALGEHQFPVIYVNPRFSKASQAKSKPSETAEN